MTGELAVPLLPCADIDEVAAFYRVLGFEVTYRQTKPNPHVALRREDLHLHFFGMDGFRAEDSYGSCIVLVEDTEAVHAAFAAGMREAFGKVLVAGIPRMTRPRRRKNAGYASGFAVVDPGGNWIRFHRAPTDDPLTPEVGEPEPTATAPDAPAGRLRQAIDNAVVLGDSKDDPAQAARVLDGALARHAADAAAAERFEALAYRAELAVRLGDPAGARGRLDEARRVAAEAGTGGTADDAGHAARLRDLDDLERSLPGDAPT
jgi:hypothetical protein